MKDLSTNVHGTSLDYKSNSTTVTNETWKNKLGTSTFNDASITNTPTHSPTKALYQKYANI
jgi:hypothetical protein